MLHLHPLKKNAVRAHGRQVLEDPAEERREEAAEGAGEARARSRMRWASTSKAKTWSADQQVSHDSDGHRVQVLLQDQSKRPGKIRVGYWPTRKVQTGFDVVEQVHHAGGTSAGSPRKEGCVRKYLAYVGVAANACQVGKVPEYFLTHHILTI